MMFCVQVYNNSTNDNYSELEIGRYIIPELFIPEFNAGTYQYIVYPFLFFRFSDHISFFRL
jgi:hypothetical protein